MRTETEARYVCWIRCGLLLFVLGDLAVPMRTLGQQSAQSDVAAIQAIRNVVAQSGGEAAWGNLTSAKESFSLVGPQNSNSVLITLLDDWSLDTTRYRRKTEGQKEHPVDHNGSPTFSVKVGGALKTAPELDQPRALAGHLPAVAAELLLQRPGYVFKIAKSQACQVDLVCVEVYRAFNPKLPSYPEELWTLSTSTGLPTMIRYRAVVFGTGEVWSQAKFLQYAPEGDFVVPVSIETSVPGRKQTWSFVSLEKNPGFDIAKFDNEVEK